MSNSNQNMMFKMSGSIHFTGIGGIGMSGIAEILYNLGYKIQGSDLGENDNVKRLRSMGIEVIIGQDGKNIANAAVIVKSTAIKDNNPEIVAAKKNKIPIVKRAEMLAEIMRLKNSVAISGAHGKTTTTSLIAAMFEAANLNPTVINGGIINSKGTNAYLGSGNYIVAEADESDGTFIKIPSTIGVITNIDAEHLDYWGDYKKLKAAYRSFIENLPFYGFGVICLDDKEAKDIYHTIIDKEIVTYGIKSDNVDIKAVNIRTDIDNSVFDVEVSERLSNKIKIISDIKLPMAGMHNVLNSLSAIAIAIKLDLSKDIIKNGFNQFKGVKRRFTKTGEVDNITIIDDYAHHPQEIEATIKTAREVIKNNPESNLISVMQPHRYTRLHNLFSEFTNCFKESDIVIIAPVFEAGEKPIDGANRDVLVSAIKQQYPNIQVMALPSEKMLPDMINKYAKSDDLVLIMGAGTSTKWANALPKQLEKLKSKVLN